MKYKTLLYIFCLFLLCIPNFLYKITNKVTLSHVILYGFIFSTILYASYDLVNNEKESMETKVDFQIEDSSKLVGALGSLFGYNEEPQIQINNDYGQGIILEEDTVQTPAPFGPIGPIDNVDTSILSPKPSEEVIQQTTNDYEAAYKKMMEPQTEPNFKFKADGCMANYSEQTPCCGQPGETVSLNRTCSKSNPICADYVAEDESWGKCTNNGGGTGNGAIVLGNYNMKPWSLNDTWKDQTSKWIWFTKNANLGTSSNSCATFQYVYYAFQPVEITLYMACGQHCYLIIENSNTRKTTKATQLPTTNNVGIAHKLTLEQGANKLQFHCYNTGFENSPCGLNVSVYDNKEEIMFHSDDSWTWFQSAPLMDAVIFDSSVSYTPVVALWNRKHKGFLKMNSNGEMDVLDSPNKNLNNSLECRGTVFLYQKQPVNNTIGNYTISLYNCGHNKYVSMNENNEMIGVSNFSQTPDEDIETWMPIKVTSTSCAFYNAKHYPNKFYLGINKNNIIGSKDADLSSQWEIVYLDVIKIGSTRQLNSVPSFVEHVYSSPLNSQVNLNDTFTTNLNNEYLYNNIYKQLQITRTDSAFYAQWKQSLLLPGINKLYYEKKAPEFEMVLKRANINIKQLLIYKNTYFACSDKGELYISNGTQWVLVANPTITTYGTTGGIGGNMVIGSMNKQDVLFCVGPLIEVSPDKTTKYGAIYYRSLTNIARRGEEWKLYSAQTDGSPITSFQHIVFCEKNKTLYSNINSDFCELTHNGKYMTIKKNSRSRPTITFTMVSLNYDGTYIVGIDKNLHIYKDSIDLSTNGLGPYEMLANNTELTKLVVVHNIIFALHKTDGKIYYVPLYGGIIKELNRKLSGNLIDIVGFNDTLYLVDNQSNVVKTQIILN